MSISKLQNHLHARFRGSRLRHRGIRECGQSSSRPLEKNMIRLMEWPGLAIAVLSLQAQVPEQIRQATISGSRGTSGKCAIEVRVDMSAEVDVYGNSGRLRTMTGQPATWARMDCTDPLPYNMSDFRFRGIDGRGQVKLVQIGGITTAWRSSALMTQSPAQRVHLRYRMEWGIRRNSHSRVSNRCQQSCNTDEQSCGNAPRVFSRRSIEPGHLRRARN